MNGYVDWNILGKYLSGACNEHEQATVEEWVASDPANARLMEEIRTLWNTRGLPQQPVEVGDAWERLQERISRHERMKSIRPDRPAVVPQRVHRQTSTLRYAGRFATLFAFVVLGGILVLRPWKTDPVLLVDQIDKTVSTQQGQRASIELSDGTTVRLNVGSKLTFPAAFAVDRREVYLEGEAFFDVSKNEEKPFVIYTREGHVQVLGTSFGIRAYPQEQQMRVAVAEGLVSLRPKGSAERDTVLLRARDLGGVADHQLNLVERGVDLNRYFAWTLNELQFRDAPFEQVVADLARWYALDIEMDLDPRAVLPLHATFTEESVGEILLVISEALDVKFDRDRRKIRFYR